MGQIAVFSDSLTDSRCYCVEEGGKVLIIDPNQGEKFPDLLEKLGWEPEKVLLTHEHCDHMQGLNILRERYQLYVICTEMCSRNLGNPVKNMSSMMEIYLRFRNEEKTEAVYDPVRCRPADVTFTETCRFLWRGHTFFLKALPGHTGGSCGIWMDEKIMFSGDYLIPGEEVITRFPGGSPEDYEKITRPCLEKLREGIHIYPGHGCDYIWKGKMVKG